MFLTTHTSIALLISTKIMSPFLGFILGFISHFLADIIPHGDESIGIKSRKLEKKEKFLFLGSIGILDLLLALFLIYFFLKSFSIDNIIVFATVIGSWLPDLLWMSIDFFNLKFLNFFLKFHKYMHTLIDYRYPLIYGLFFQISFIIFLSYFTY